MTAVHALCNKIKMKLVRPMSQEFCLCFFNAGVPVCSATILLSSSESLSAGSVDAPGRSEVTTKDHRMGDEILGTLLVYLYSCQL